jgi:hypothetical protein
MKLKIFITFLVCSMFIQAQEFKKTGTAGFVFLEIPVTARSAGLGDASIALADMNSDGVFSNPASLGFINQKNMLSVSYAPWIADIKHYAASYSYTNPLGVVGLGVNYMDYGSIPRTYKTGAQDVYKVDGTFSAYDIAIGLSYSKMLTDKFSFGATVKYVKEAIDVYSASNVLFDGGVLYYTGLGSLRIAADIQNFGVDAKFINETFRMPSVLKLGAAAEVLGSFDSEYRVTAMVEALHPNDGNERMIVGLETCWNNMFTLRGGYKFYYDEETYSFGVGVNPQFASYPVNVDFSFSNYGRLGNIVRFTLQLGLL